MNKRERAETFARYVGLELKGKIITQGHTAKSVAEEMGRSPAAFNRWLNGKVELPLSVLGEACEVIDLDPQGIVEDAYSRLCVEFGERDGFKYPDEDNVVVGRFGQNAEPENVIPDEARAADKYDGDRDEEP